MFPQPFNTNKTLISKNRQIFFTTTHTNKARDDPRIERLN